MSSIYSDIKTLKLIGEKRAELYKKLGILSIKNLLQHYPRRYINFNEITNINDALIGDIHSIKATVVSKKCCLIKKTISVFKVIVQDDTGKLNVTIFNNEYIFKTLQLNAQYIFYGKIEDNDGVKQMSNPTIVKHNEKYKIKPIYPSTAGLSSLIIEKNIFSVINSDSFTVSDPLPEYIVKQNGLCSLEFAFKNIHFAKTIDDLKLSKKRLMFDELFYLQMAIKLMKSENDNSKNNFVLKDISSLDEVINSLPFKPTNHQLKAINDCITDMQSDTSMNRLIQGDVGSGKTLVAMVMMFLVSKNNMQSCLMAPTELLANQHYSNISSMLQKFNINIRLLTGSTKKKEKEMLLNELKNGNIDILIGTHALLTENVEFKTLSLVITDEQHRFGVKQRERLLEKSYKPHSMVMSATPIPRTLSLIIYGDLNVSLITEMPEGRVEIKTMAITPNKRERAFTFLIDNILKKGQQGYIVCPLIEETESGLQSVLNYASSIQQNQLKNFNVAVIHGKMKSKEKDSIMLDFKDKKYDILVSTTVIEVGIDVKNATFIMIENAERFGLSALHQLRGRVGRNNLQSYCVLVHNSKSMTTAHRLKVLCDYNDGFKIAEEDFKIRGAGDFFGERQHGLPTLKLANLIDDVHYIHKISNICDNILNVDNNLSLSENKSIKNEINELFNTETRTLN